MGWRRSRLYHGWHILRGQRRALQRRIMQASNSTYNFFGDMSMLSWILVNGYHHRIHGWSIEQQINKFQTNARRRHDRCNNNCDNTSLPQLHYCTYAGADMGVAEWKDTSTWSSWSLRIRVSLRSEHCFRRNSSYYC